MEDQDADESYKISSINKNIKLYLNDFYVNIEILDADREITLGSISPRTNVFNRRDKIPGRRKKTGTFINHSLILSPQFKRVLIYGSPGTGKTTLCKKMYYDFSCGALWEGTFENVHWIHLRRFRDDFEISEDLLNGKNKLKDLYILDGWDEISDLLNDKKKRDVAEKIRKLHSMPNLILTSRPYVEIDFSEYDRVLEVTGFSIQSVRKYIRNILTQTNQLQNESEVVEYLNASVISDMATIPILLDIFLYSWDEIKKIKESEITMTKLYEIMILLMWNKFLNDRDIESKSDRNSLQSVVTREVEQEFQLLCKLAREWVEHGKMEFYYSNFQEVDSLKESIVKTPFLNGIIAGNCDVNRQNYEFIHLTVLEFFAAFEIVNYRNEKELESFISCNKYNPRFSVVLAFAAGLINLHLHKLNPANESLDREEKLERFFDYLDGDPFDLIGIYHTKMLVNCLLECESGLSERRRDFICENYRGLADVPTITFQKDRLNCQTLKHKENTSLEFFKRKLVQLFPNLNIQDCNSPKDILVKIMLSDITDIQKIEFLAENFDFELEATSAVEEVLLNIHQSEVYARVIFILALFPTASSDMITNKMFFLSKFIPFELELLRRQMFLVFCGGIIRKPLSECHKDALMGHLNRHFSINTILESREMRSKTRERLIMIFKNEKVSKNRELMESTVIDMLKEGVRVLTIYDSFEPLLIIKEVDKMMDCFEICAVEEIILKILTRSKFKQSIRKSIASKYNLTKENMSLLFRMTGLFLLALFHVYDEENPILTAPYLNCSNISEFEILFTLKKYASRSQGLHYVDNIFELSGSVLILLPSYPDNMITNIVTMYNIFEDKHPMFFKLFCNIKLSDDHIDMLVSGGNKNKEGLKSLFEYQLHSKTARRYIIEDLKTGPTKMCGRIRNKYQSFEQYLWYRDFLKNITDDEAKDLISHDSTFEVYLTSVESVLEDLLETSKSYWTEGTIPFAIYTVCKNYLHDKNFQKFKNALLQIFEWNDVPNKISREKLELFCKNSDNYTSEISHCISNNQKASYIAGKVLKLTHDNYNTLKRCKKLQVRIMTCKCTKNMIREICQNLNDDHLGAKFVDILDGHIYHSILDISWIIENFSDYNAELLLPLIVNHKDSGDFPDLPLCIFNNCICYSNQIKSKPLSERTINFIWTYNKRLWHYSLLPFTSNVTRYKRFCKNLALADLVRFDRKQKCLLDLEAKINDLEFKFSGKNATIVDFRLIDPKEKTAEWSDLITELQSNEIYNMIYLTQIRRFLAPYHIDLSENNLKDSDMKVISKFLLKGTAQIILLSKNDITKIGFEVLMRNVGRSQLKHLALNRNKIYFEFSDGELDPRFAQIFLNGPSAVKHCATFETLDISHNYIDKRFLLTLSSLSNKPSNKNSVYDEGGHIRKGSKEYLSYISVNRCHIVFDGHLNENLKPALHNIVNGLNYDRSVDLINESKGCVAYAEKKRPFNYSSHVILIIETISEGQRKLQTAELVQLRHSNFCKILLSDVDPNEGSSLHGRLLSYEIPAVGYFDNESIQRLIRNIQGSRDKIGLKRYGLDRTEEGVLLNCVDWANAMMEPLLQSKMSNLHIPSSFSIYYHFRKHRDVIFAGFILIFVSLIVDLFC